jgi:phosphoglycolate phosphatase
VLLLFDIDGTLVQKAHAEHRDAMHAALTTVYGIADPAAARVEAAGRTDLEIARQICVLSGVDAARIDAGLADLQEAVAEEYAHRVPDDLSARVAPGAADMLQTLAARDGVRLSLLTGNIETVARLKLRAAGLGHWFEPGQGGFGSDHEDRAALPPIARARVGRRAGLDRPWPRARTVVVGDTPRDVACARADGVRVVAVTTGPFGRDDLTGADAVVDRATELLDVL